MCAPCDVNQLSKNSWAVKTKKEVAPPSKPLSTVSTQPSNFHAPKHSDFEIVEDEAEFEYDDIEFPTPSKMSTSMKKEKHKKSKVPTSEEVQQLAEDLQKYVRTTLKSQKPKVEQRKDEVKEQPKKKTAVKIESSPEIQEIHDNNPEDYVSLPKDSNHVFEHFQL